MTDKERTNILLGIKLGLYAAINDCTRSAEVEMKYYNYTEADVFRTAAGYINRIEPIDVLAKYEQQRENDELCRILSEASAHVDSWPQWKKDQMRALVATTGEPVGQ